jgi:hypothetical protein
MKKLIDKKTQQYIVFLYVFFFCLAFGSVFANLFFGNFIGFGLGILTCSLFVIALFNNYVLILLAKKKEVQ